MMKPGIAALIASTPALIQAQSVGGRVVAQPGGIPLRRAVVELLVDSASKWVDSTTTDASGVFFLNASRAGTYYVQFTTAGTQGVSVRSPAVTLGLNEEVQNEYVVPLGLLVFMEFETETPVRAKGVTHPKYPRELEKSGIEGSVQAQFVVDADGRVDSRTFKVLHSSHPDFSQAVQDQVYRMSFEPARIGGRPVRQLVQQRFEFHVGRAYSR